MNRRPDSLAPLPRGAVELTAGTCWEYRAVVRGRPGPWRRELGAALRGLAPQRRPLPAWPERWIAAGPFPRGTPWPADLAAPPPSGRRVRAGRDGTIDLAAAFGPPRAGRAAILLAELRLPEAATLDVHAGADWWMEWRVDGRPVFDTLARGNGSRLADQAHEFRLRLGPGPHVLAVRVVSGNGGWAFASEATVTGPRPRPAPRFSVEARRRFRVADPARYVSLTLVGPEHGRARLNGREMAGPSAAMLYRRVHGLPPSWLRRGMNELRLAWPPGAARDGAHCLGLRRFRGTGAARPLRAGDVLWGLPPGAARIRGSPVFHGTGEGPIGVACRTNAPVSVRLRIARRVLVSPAGLSHRFDLADLPVAARRLVEPQMRAARETIAPRLAAARFTAVFCGHAHCYERTEPPGGPVEIASGGAGGYLYERAADRTPNPHSAAFASAHHFCLVRVGPRACRLEARGVDGRVLDRRAWNAVAPPAG